MLCKGSSDHSPTIINLTKHSIVVFEERGIFYNKQVLQPGEAVNITKKQTGRVLPYYIHAVVGDERCLPDRKKSLTNLATVAAIPTAFCVGAFATAMSAGTLAGPSAALAPLVTGMVVKGVVIDAAAITAGGIMANRAGALAEMLIKKHPEAFMAKKGRLKPGRRFVTIQNGVDEGPLKLITISKREFNKLNISSFKSPIN